MLTPAHSAGRNRLLSTLLLILAVSVFAWGTAYKVSLYHAADPTQVPVKLCTRASDASRAQAAHLVETAPVNQVVVAYAELLPPLPSPAVPRRIAAGFPVIRFVLLRVPLLMRRPPPAQERPTI